MFEVIHHQSMMKREENHKTEWLNKIPSCMAPNSGDDDEVEVVDAAEDDIADTTTLFSLILLLSSSFLLRISLLFLLNPQMAATFNKSSSNPHRAAIRAPTGLVARDDTNLLRSPAINNKTN